MHPSPSSPTPSLPASRPPGARLRDARARPAVVEAPRVVGAQERPVLLHAALGERGEAVRALRGWGWEGSG